MAVATSSSTTTVDPAVAPFLNFGLSEAMRLYQTGGPQFFPGQTYVSPSQQTQDALAMAEQAARAPSPVISGAQNLAANTIGGGMLNGNPFFSGAFQGAADEATRAYQNAVGSMQSNFARSGRLGSGAMANQQGQADSALARALSNTAGSLAFTNYANERGLQQQAMNNAGAIFGQSFLPSAQLASVGAAQESIAAQPLQEQLARFTFQQQQPYTNLQSYLSAVYGTPMIGATTTQQTGMPSNNTAQLIGGLATAGGLLADYATKSNQANFGSALKSGWNWLTSGF